MNLRSVQLELRLQLRERRVWVAAGIFAYAVLAMPVVVSKPPVHVQAAATEWFGSSDPGVLFLYLWTDLAMNKLLAVVGVVLGAGLLLRERDQRCLELFQSKPLSLQDYYRLKLVGALGVMTLLFVGAHLLAIPYFGRMVPGFSSGLFLLSMLVQLGAALFAVSLSAALASWTKSLGMSAISSLMLLFLLVGMAFVGVYNPAWAGLSSLNPFAQGGSVITHVQALEPLRHVILPMVVLVGMNLAMVWLGLQGLRRWEV